MLTLCEEQRNLRNLKSSRILNFVITNLEYREYSEAAQKGDLLPFQWRALHQTLKLRPMRRCKLVMVAVAIAAVCLIPDLTVIAAQVFGFWRGPVIQNTPPPTEFVVARWRYSTNGNIGGMGWAHNYPEGEMHLNQFIRGVTNINVEPLSYRIVNLSSDEVFEYPFALVSEPGEMS